MNSRFLRFVLLLVLMLAALVIPTSAHEGREVGEYVLTFGWRVEPAFAGVMNGPELFIEAHDHEAHEDEHAEEAEDGHSDVATFEGVEVSLQYTVSFGDQTLTAPLRQAWMEPGHFIADLIPTLPGDYTFRIFGTIGDTEVDETFSASDGQFSSVEPLTDVTFPSSEGMEAKIAALEDRIAALEAKIAELEAE